MKRLLFDDYGVRPAAIFVIPLLLLGGLIGGLYAAFGASAFECPHGQHSYVMYYQPVVTSAGTVTTVAMVPVMGCEA